MAKKKAAKKKPSTASRIKKLLTSKRKPAGKSGHKNAAKQMPKR